MKFLGHVLLIAWLSFLVPYAVQDAIAQESGSVLAYPIAEIDETANLWPGKPPGRVTDKEELDTSTPKSRKQAGMPVIRLGHVSKPMISIYKPEASADTGAAVIVCPGGGYNILAYDLEGTEVCDWLNSIGVTGILLKYRVPRPDKNVPVEPLQDVQRAISMVRHNAKDWSIDPEKIGVLGFSAGGNLAARASTRFGERAYKKVDAIDEVSCRPDFTLLIYPAYLVGKGDELLSDLIKVTPETPPAFLTMAFNDPINPENILRYGMALAQQKIPCEVHLFKEGGHGYGLRLTELPAPRWPEQATVWMQRSGWLKK